MASYNYYGNPYGAAMYPVNYPQFQPQQIQSVPQIQQQNIPQPQQTNQPSIIWISSENEALSFPVAPNNAVTLWSTTEPVVYLKQADATGKPTLKTYDLVERKQSASSASSSSGAKVIEYAEKNDVIALAGAVRGFDDIITSLKSDIETMKGDLYGVAGRKKTATKKTSEDDE